MNIVDSNCTRKLLPGSSDRLTSLVVHLELELADSRRRDGRRVRCTNSSWLLGYQTFGDKVGKSSGWGAYTKRIVRRPSASAKGDDEGTGLQSGEFERTIHARVFTNETRLAIRKHDPVLRLVPPAVRSLSFTLTLPSRFPQPLTEVLDTIRGLCGLGTRDLVKRGLGRSFIEGEYEGRRVNRGERCGVG